MQETSDPENSIPMHGSYAVVIFEDGIEIIRNEWAVYDCGRIIGSYFPSNVTKSELNHLLKLSTPSEFDKVKWSAGNGEPYLITRHCCSTNTFEAAERKMEFYIQFSSDIDSDDGKNAEKLKRSRHSRCAKRMSDEDDLFTEESQKSKRKPLRIISNVLWKSETKEKKSGTSVSAFDQNSNPNVEDTSSSMKGDAEMDGGGAGESILQNEQMNIGSGEKVARTTCGKENEDPLVSSNGKASKKVDTSTKKSKKKKKNGLQDDSNKTVIKKLNRINLMMTSLYENGGQAVKQVPTFDSEDDELQMFPAATKEELLLIENKLKKSKRFSRKVCNATSQLGHCHSTNVTINNMLNKLMTFKMGQLYTFQGRSGKKPAFKNLELYKVVRKAVNKSNPKITVEEIKSGVSRWLITCKESDKRLQEKLRKEEEERREQVEALDDSESEESEDSEDSEHDSKKDDE